MKSDLIEIECIIDEYLNKAITNTLYPEGQGWNNGAYFVLHQIKSHLNKLKGGVTMGTIIVKNAVVRKPGYLYYIDKNGSVCEAKMARLGRKKGTGKAKKKAKKMSLKQLAAKKSTKKKKE